MTKGRGKENGPQPVELFMMETGWTAKSMEIERRTGLMELVIMMVHGRTTNGNYPTL